MARPTLTHSRTWLADRWLPQFIAKGLSYSCALRYQYRDRDRRGDRNRYRCYRQSATRL